MWFLSSDGWLGVDLTRMTRRVIRREQHVIQIKRLRRGKFFHKYSFVEVVTKVGYLRVVHDSTDVVAG